MRIVGGELRGRPLATPKTDAIRPTTDRTRESLFNILAHAYPEATDGGRVMDLFAGTGAVGIEALSRGARHATFVENAPPALAALRANIAACRAGDSCTVVAADVLSVRPGPPADLVFLDPPYGQELIVRALAHLRATGRIAPGALIVAEAGRDEPPPCAVPLAARLHGAARITIWREMAFL